MSIHFCLNNKIRTFFGAVKTHPESLPFNRSWSGRDTSSASKLGRFFNRFSSLLLILIDSNCIIKIAILLRNNRFEAKLTYQGLGPFWPVSHNHFNWNTKHERSHLGSDNKLIDSFLRKNILEQRSDSLFVPKVFNLLGLCILDVLAIWSQVKDLVLAVKRTDNWINAPIV